MFTRLTARHTVSVFLIALTALPAAVRAEGVEDSFYKAYYLEHRTGDYAGAADLYGKVADNRGVEAWIRDEARARLAACREELATTDFARLMPPQTLAYFELNRPGEQIARLLDQLGLLAEPGGLTSPDGQRVAISPELLKEVLGLRGAAIAVTGVNMSKQQPAGVAVFHPGNMDVIRGLIETGLPIGGEPVEPIEGFPTYCVEGKVYVTITSKLVVVSGQRSLIQGVVRRLKGEDRPCLADDETMSRVITDRGDDALVFFFVNAKRVMPIVSGLMGMGAAKSPELAMANAVLDLNSMESIAGHLGISDEGIGLDVSLRLAEGHRNLVYNFFRMPGITKDTFKYIPEGAAAFLAASLNEPTYSMGETWKGNDEEPPVVTAMDFGREIFGNIVSFTVFVLPPEGTPAGGKWPIPDAALVITVNDPSKSEALWTQMLGLASMATGKAPMEGTSLDVGGTRVRSYSMPEGVTIYLAMIDHEMIMATSQGAVARSIEAKQTGQSIFNDPKFAPVRRRIGKDTTKVVFAHPNRCAQIAKMYMGLGEIAEMEPWINTMEDTVVSTVFEHSDQEFHFSALVGGIPDVGELVSALIMEEKHRAERHATHRVEQHGKIQSAMKQGGWEDAIKTVETVSGIPSDSAEQLVKAFQKVAVEKGNHQAAGKIGEAVFKVWHDDALNLNNFAWALLTEDQYGGKHDDLALKLSERSNEITGYEIWSYVDTLALAKFKTGDAKAAVKLEKKAIQLSEGQGIDELKAALARFQDAIKQGEPPGAD